MINISNLPTLSKTHRDILKTYKLPAQFTSRSTKINMLMSYVQYQSQPHSEEHNLIPNLNLDIYILHVF